jgi:hypothetical protein
MLLVRYIEVPEEKNIKLGIHILDIDFYEYARRKHKTNRVNYSYMLNMIKQRIKYDNIRMDAFLFATFCLYHEEGHWLDFIQSGLSGKEYMQEDYKYRKSIEDIGDQIVQMDDNNPEKEKLAYQHTVLYRNIPIELIADNYACKELSTNIDFIKRIFNSRYEL